MSNFTVVDELLSKQYPNLTTQTIVVNNMTFRFILPPLKLAFEKYSLLKILILSRCDLRKLQNFPVFHGLKDLDLSYNSLQGTLNYLIPLQNLEYLNLSNNYISDTAKFLPLNRIKKVQIFIDKNPFTQAKNWKNKLKKINIKYLNKAKILVPEKPTKPGKESQKQKQKEKSYFTLQKQKMLGNQLKKAPNKVSFAEQCLKVERSGVKQSQKPGQGLQIQSILFHNSSDQNEQSQQPGVGDYKLMDRIGLQLQQNIDFEQLNSQQLQQLQQLQDEDEVNNGQILESQSQSQSSS